MKSSRIKGKRGIHSPHKPKCPVMRAFTSHFFWCPCVFIVREDCFIFNALLLFLASWRKQSVVVEKEKRRL